MTTHDEYENCANIEDNQEKLEATSTIIPPGAVLYEICFKVSTSIFSYENNDLELPCLVIVQADRGYDIGVAIRCLAPDEIPTNGKTIRKVLSVITNDDKYIKYMLQSKAVSEKQALTMSRTICSELKVGPSVDIVSVEFQADRKKLTVYYRKHADVSLCKLIRKLHSAFKMRIWMENIDTMQLDPDQDILQTFQRLEERYFTLASIDPSDPNHSDNNQENPDALPDPVDPTSDRPPVLLVHQSPEPKLQSTSPSGLSFLPRTGGSTPQSIVSTSPFASEPTGHQGEYNYEYNRGMQQSLVRPEVGTSYAETNAAAKYYQYNQLMQPAVPQQQRKNQLPHRPPPPSGYSDYLPQAPPYPSNLSGNSSLSQPRRSTQSSLYSQQPPLRNNRYGDERDPYYPQMAREYNQQPGPDYSSRTYYDSGMLDHPNSRNLPRGEVVPPPRYHSLEAPSNLAYYGRYQSPRDANNIASSVLVDNPLYAYRQASRSTVQSSQSSRRGLYEPSTTYDWIENHSSMPSRVDRNPESYHPGLYETHTYSIPQQEESRLLSSSTFDGENGRHHQYYPTEQTSLFFPSELRDRITEDLSQFEDSFNRDRFHLE